MKVQIWLSIAAALVATCSTAAAAQQAGQPAPDRIAVTVDTTQTAAPVSKYLYGAFIEHIGPLIYRSLWSEMLDDRKFYFPVLAKEPASPGTGQGGPGRNMPLRKWRPLGSPEAVVMDKDQPFVGEQSPRIQSDASGSSGIRQSGFNLSKGKRYTGRIYLRGSQGVKVKVALVWGGGANDRQSSSLSSLAGTYKKFTFSFTAGEDAEDGALEITGAGSGDFHIGAVSLMPADNVQGFRPDTIALLRDLHAGMWRLPGGNFLSDFDWHDSVGDIDKRPPMFDDAWKAMQTNDVGMDEFMTLCKLIGVDPYITVNAGFGDAHSAAEEVEYINGSVETRLGALRAKNGHPEPYNVKLWNIGNEPYGAWQHGHTYLKYYVLKHNDFAKAMRQVDPSMTLLASGAMPDEMTVEGQARVIHPADPQTHFGDDSDWTGGLLAHSWGNFDGLTEHWYARVGKRFDYDHAKTLPANAPTEGGYVPVEESLLEWVRHPANRVRKKAEEWNEYERRFPAMRDKKTFLSIDEYSYSGAPSNLKMALAYGMILNEMFRHTDFLKMAAYTMGVSAIDYDSKSAAYNARGLLYKLYRDEFGTLPVAVTGNSPQPKPKFPPYGDQPETSSGSPTYPLDTVAALTPDRKYLTVAIVNGTESEQKFDLNVNGSRIAGKSKLCQMTGKDLEAMNRLGQEPQVQVKESEIGNASQGLSVAPISISIYRFPLSGAAQ